MQDNFCNKEIGTNEILAVLFKLNHKPSLFGYNFKWVGILNIIGSSILAKLEINSAFQKNMISCYQEKMSF